MKFYWVFIALFFLTISNTANIKALYADDTKTADKKDPYPHVLVTMKKTKILGS